MRVTVPGALVAAGLAVLLAVPSFAGAYLTDFLFTLMVAFVLAEYDFPDTAGSCNRHHDSEQWATGTRCPPR